LEQKVKIRRVFPDGTAEVVHIRESACSGDCHKCSGCGAAKESITLTARNAIGAGPGEVVIVKSDSAPVLRGAVVLYILPLVLFILGYLLTASGWGGCLGFVIGIVAVIVYDRKVAKKEETVYTITGYAQKKGDNNLG